tara:strand:- start:230 stop:469 length:240 start_codon:yes stop_codon:yes gene_type:complete
VLEEVEKNIDLSSVIDRRNQGIRIKNILTKALTRRTPEEVVELIVIISDIKFFRERKEIKPSDFRELVSAFQYTEIDEN